MRGRLAARRRSLEAEVVRRTPPPPVAAGSLNRVCRPDAWDDPEWVLISRALGMPQGDDRVHRKVFEWVQCVHGLERLGVLGPEAVVLGVGAGHECVAYYLTLRTRLTVATDLYAGDFVESFAGEADPDFLTDPDRYALFPYRRDHLAALPADGTRLPFADGSFDAVWSLSSIEHFGGHEAAAGAMREIARVLRPGGVACVATELILEGGIDAEFFTRDELDEFVIRASGLRLVDGLDDRPPPREHLDRPIVLPQDTWVTPHIVLGRGALRWTSVVLFLRKPLAREVLRWGAAGVGRRLRHAGGRRRG